jgi:protein-tyrosine phosphatase
MKTVLGVNTMVTLIEDFEFDMLKVPDLLEATQDKGIDTLWFPIQDRHAPTSMSNFLDLVDQVISDLEDGKTVLVHCKGGVGRTGTLVAAILVALGYTPAESIKVVRNHRLGAVENTAQEEWVKKVDEALDNPTC